MPQLNRDRAEIKAFIAMTVFVFATYILLGMASFTNKNGPLTLNPIFLTMSVEGDYYNSLAKSFLQGRLDVTDTKGELDLIAFNGKHYLLWPPVPAVVLTPIVAIFGSDLPDRLINVLIGCVNVFLFLIIGRKLRHRYNFQFLKTNIIIAFGTFWAFGTVHLYMSLSGRVWLISQIMAQTFLLAAIYVLLDVEKKTKKYWFGGFWFAMAVYSRNDLIFSGLFLVALIYEDSQVRILNPIFLKPFSVFLVFFVIFSLINLEYNYLRFGSPFDNGANYHMMGEIFKEKFEKWGYLSTHYIPHNFYYEVFKMPEFTTSPPYIVMDFEGFGLLWSSPLFFLLFPSVFLWIKEIRERGRFNASLTDGSFMLGAAAISILPIAFTIFTVMGTGEFQFGARYTLDFHIFLCLLLLPVIQKFIQYGWFRFIAAALIFFSCCINAIGVFLYY